MGHDNDKFFVMSVQHTGTRFLVDLLDCKGAHVQHIHGVEGEKMEGRQIVVPLRHPRAIAESWHNRGKSCMDLVERFDELMAYEGDYHVVTLDTLEREAQLAELGEFKTNWKPIGHYNGRARWNETFQNGYDLLIEKHGDWFRKYYKDV